MENSKNGGYNAGDINFGGRPRFVNKNKNPGSAEEDGAGFKRATPGAPPIAATAAETSALNAAATPFVAKSIPDNKPKIAPEELEDDPEFLQAEVANNATLVNMEPADGEWSSFPEIHKKTKELLIAKGYAALFPIQQHSFYPVYTREDLIARDLTGSGKTFAFGLPTVEYLRRHKLLGTRKVQAIILAPTRELALQVTAEMTKLKHYENEFKIVTVYGGVNIDEQIRQLRQGVDIFVGTTGRVLDHIERGNIDFSGLKSLILDEADQMLKLGFKEDVDRILKTIRDVVPPQALQICLFSATIPSWVKQLSRTYMKKGFRVVDLAQDLKNKTAKQVAHLAIECPYQNRMSALADILICYGGNAKTIVFTQTKQDANSLILSDKIKQDIEVMHGDIAQNQREVTMKRFKEGKFQVLVATDVASRGLDIKDVDLVIQIEPPKDTETYIHRSGRTARAGKTGTCITFYTKKTYEFIQKIEDQAGIRLKRIGVPQPEDVIKASSRGILKNLEDVNEDVLYLFEDLAKVLIDQYDGDSEKALQIALAYCSGHYKHKLQSKSLLNGQEGHTTAKMIGIRGRFGPNNAYNVLKKYWDPRVGDNVRNMKGMRDGSGVVFDIRSENFEAFMDNFARLQETGERIDFEVMKCGDLPELQDEFGYGGSQNWRDNGRDRDGGGGGYQGNNPRGGGGYQSRGGGGYGDRGGGMSRGGGYQQRDSYQQESQGWGARGGGRGGGRGDRGDRGRGGGYGGGRQDYDNDGGSSWSRGAGTGNRGGGGYGGQGGGYQEGGGGFRPKTAGPPGGSAPMVKKSGGSGTMVYVSNLRFQVNEQDLMDFFKSQNFDPVRARLLYDNEGNSKGTGFVEMSSPGDAQEAAKRLNEEYYQGRKLVVNVAKDKQ